MKNIVLAVFFVFLTGCSNIYHNLDHRDTTKTIHDLGVVPIHVDQGFIGSGFAISDHFIVTANHVIMTNYHYYVNDIPVTVYKQDPVNDIAILYIEKHHFKILKLADPLLTQNVYAAGYIGYNQTYYPIICGGRITSIDFNNRILSNCGLQPGMSGCPLLNDNGDVVGVTTSCMVWDEYDILKQFPNTSMSIFTKSEKITQLLTVVSY